MGVDWEESYRENLEGRKEKEKHSFFFRDFDEIYLVLVLYVVHVFMIVKLFNLVILPFSVGFSWLLLSVKIISSVFISGFLFLVYESIELELFRNELYSCEKCENYRRGYQFKLNTFVVTLCPGCESEMAQVEYKDRLKWMKTFPEFRKKGFWEIVRFSCGYRFKTKKKLRLIGKQIDELIEIRTFMDYTKKGKDLPDSHTKMIDDAKALELQLEKELGRLLYEVPLVGVGRIKGLIFKLKS